MTLPCQRLARLLLPAALGPAMISPLLAGAGGSGEELLLCGVRPWCTLRGTELPAAESSLAGSGQLKTQRASRRNGHVHWPYAFPRAPRQLQPPSPHPAPQLAGSRAAQPALPGPWPRSCKAHPQPHHRHAAAAPGLWHSRTWCLRARSLESARVLAPASAGAGGTTDPHAHPDKLSPTALSNRQSGA